MSKIDDPIIIAEQMGKHMPDYSPKCSECGEKLNDQATHLIRRKKFIYTLYSIYLIMV